MVDTAAGAGPGTGAGADLDALIRDRVDSMVTARVDEIMALKAAEKAAKPKKMAIIATKGTLDWAYPPLILASTGATLGWDVGIFFTFYGLKILQKDRHLEVGTTGNPAMPMPVPMPQLLTALPGMTPMASWMMKRQFKDHGVASIDELVELCVELGVKMIPCGMTMDVFGFSEKGFIEGIEPVCGATHFLDWAADADVSLFV
ncbi:MAG TPA: DsrE/DsrF/DrsH-like family protein [Candidatus Limnocylindrales bacterium]